MTHTLTRRRIAWYAHDGHGLGRHVEHDSRSLQYVFDPSPVKAISSVTHTRNIGILDQGSLGSCTGNAMEGAAATDPLYGAIPTSNAARPSTDVLAAEKQAVALYSAATRLDSYPGTYPPQDTGSSGLAVAKAAQAAGLIAGYQHATDVNSAVAALMVTPIIIGINWYSSFDNPASDGTITITRGASIRGGHELCVVGYEASGSSGTVASTDKLVIANSWGTSWGAKGYCKLSVADFTRLLGEDGDATVPVPLTSPTPTPDPTPTDVDKAMWSAAQTWAKAKGFA